MSCNCVATQSAAAGILILITVFFGFMPILLKHCLLRSKQMRQSKVDEIVSVSLVFGAGILFATSVLHMLFETREGVDKLISSGYITYKQYPYAELFLCVGFIFIYAFEEVILFTFIKESDSLPHSHGCEVDGNQVLEVQSKMSEKDTHKSNVANKVSFLRTIIFMFALYMHTLFEGLAVGIAETPGEVWLLAGAIAAHKIFISFSTGNELMSQSRRVYFVSIGLLAIMPTIGTIIGVVLSEEWNNETGNFVLSFLTGVSGGVILFVVFCEILEKERSKNTGRIQNMIAFSVGFACMASILVIPEGKKEQFTSTTTNQPILIEEFSLNN